MNGLPITGATNQTFTVTVSGNYTVSVIDTNGCISFSAVQPVYMTGNEQDELENFHVFPNPAINIVSIQHTGGIEAESIQICDAAGRACTFRTISTQKDICTLDINGLPSGVYILKVSGGGKSSYGKLILQAAP